MQKSVFIYARYSTDLQNDETIEAQFAACADYAEKQGWLIAARYEDRAISGTSFNQRPGMKRMLEAIKRDPPDILLCTAIGDHPCFYRGMEPGREADQGRAAYERFIEQRTGGAFKSTQDRIDFMKRVEKELNEKRRSWERLQVSVVAGAGFEPATFRL